MTSILQEFIIYADMAWETAIAQRYMHLREPYVTMNKGEDGWLIARILDDFVALVEASGRDPWQSLDALGVVPAKRYHTLEGVWLQQRREVALRRWSQVP